MFVLNKKETKGLTLNRCKNPIVKIYKKLEFKKTVSTSKVLSLNQIQIG